MFTRYNCDSLQRPQYPEGSEGGQVSQVYAHGHVAVNTHPQPYLYYYTNYYSSNVYIVSSVYSYSIFANIISNFVKFYVSSFICGHCYYLIIFGQL